jgi:hypothetical protein
MSGGNPFDVLHASLKEYARGLGSIHYPNTNVVSYFNTSKYSDLVILCEGQKFNVHKIILCGQSKYFSTICDGDWKVRLMTGNLDLTAAEIVHNTRKRPIT